MLHPLARWPPLAFDGVGYTAAAALPVAVPGDALLDLPAGLTRMPPEHLRLAAGGDCCGGGTGREVSANLHNSSTEPVGGSPR